MRRTSRDIIIDGGFSLNRFSCRMYGVRSRVNSGTWWWKWTWSGENLKKTCMRKDSNTRRHTHTTHKQIHTHTYLQWHSMNGIGFRIHRNRSDRSFNFHYGGAVPDAVQCVSRECDDTASTMIDSGNRDVARMTVSSISGFCKWEIVRTSV